MNYKLFILIMFGIILAGNLASAYTKDVAYIVSGPFKENPVFVSVLNELNFSYDRIINSNVKTTDFSEYRLILLNNEYFYNPEEIPINEFPAVLVNGDNMADWGWTTRVSKARNSVPFHANIIDLTHPIAKGITTQDIPVYTNKNADIFYFEQANKFNGLTNIVSTSGNSEEVLIAAVEAGTVLTKVTKPDTYVNANTVFFGASASEYWTPETRLLFKNSILWTLNEMNYTYEIKAGNNLISFPILLKSNDINQITNQGVTLKEFTTSIVDATQIFNNKGYFITSDTNKSLFLQGTKSVKPQTVSLHEGMNLVGLTSTKTKTFAQATLPSQVIEISKRNADGSYTTATKYASGWYNPFDIEPGVGYWFKLNGAATWTYTP